ncbi:hypothetical protein SUDANB120_06071 [Streptomyces sp. enrichment culture]
MALSTRDSLWTRATADRYDAEEAEASSAAVLEPTLAFLAEPAGDGRALEFAIGTGRVGVPLRERGVPVVRIEPSEHMAAVLRRKIDDTLPVVIGDMATAVVSGGFTLVYLVHDTIANLLTQDEQVECFRNAARHPEPGGPVRHRAGGAAAAAPAARPGRGVVRRLSAASRLRHLRAGRAGARLASLHPRRRRRPLPPRKLPDRARPAGLGAGGRRSSGTLPGITDHAHMRPVQPSGIVGGAGGRHPWGRGCSRTSTFRRQLHCLMPKPKALNSPHQPAGTRARTLTRRL